MLKSYFPLSHFSLSNRNRQRLFLVASFLLPALIFFIYFAGHNFNILTVDLGQQYIDFFAFLRQNLLHQPLKLVYSFQNGLGGAMIGTYAYYLASPFNLLIFFFSPKQLPFALLLIITLKIGSIGLAAFYYWQKKAKPFFALAASLAYSLSSYVIANHFNLMWLDALILLPLLIRSIDSLFKTSKSHLIFITFCLLVTNFYVGFMALFFGFLYFLTILLRQKANRRQELLIYLKKSGTGTLLAAFLLLPTLAEIIVNKSGSPQLAFTWQFNPLHELTKLTIGSYNFQQMQTGLPNIYFTMPFLFLTLLYFTSKQIKIEAKLANLSLLLFLLLSLFFQPLVLLWHLGQFPTWYPGRFTFVFIFFCLNLAIIFLNQKEKLSFGQKLLLAIIAVSIWTYCYFNKRNFSFLNQTSLLLTGLFLVLAFLFISLIYRSKLAPFSLFLIILVETTCNLICCFNNLSYQNDQDYVNFSQNMNQITSTLQRKDNGFYRMEKDFYRSDDDAFTANYKGLSVFNSLVNQRTLNFLAQMGYLHNSNSVTNNGGTPISDAILGLKYYIEPNLDSDLEIKSNKKIKFENYNQRRDLNGSLITSNAQLALYRNQRALPVLFLSPVVRKFSFVAASPIINQQNIWQAITGFHSSLIRKMIWSEPRSANGRLKKATAFLISASGSKEAHQLIINITSPQLADYYVQLPAGLDENNLSLRANKKNYNLAVRNNQAHLLNLGYLAKGQRMKLNLTAKAGTINLKDLSLWQINTKLLNKQARHFKIRQPRFSLTNPLTIQSQTFTTSKRRHLFTTIPYSKDWLIIDRHHLLPQRPFARTFLATDLGKGKHQLTIIYLPFAFLIGLLVSLFTLIIIFILEKQK